MKGSLEDMFDFNLDKKTDLQEKVHAIDLVFRVDEEPSEKKKQGEEGNPSVTESKQK